MTDAKLANEPGAPPSGRVYAGYVLLLLFLANTMNSIDRSMVNVLVEPIRKEFGFTDTEVGAISGLGFALFYGALGLPIARLADQRSRKRLLAAGVAFWSLMTVLTGRATGFWTMLAARFGVGAGEATCYPASLSLIGDYFEPAKRPRAIALFQMGIYAGFILGAVLSSLITAHYGWRAAFLTMGLPGLLLAVILLLTLREPVRGTLDGTSLRRGFSKDDWRATLGLLATDRTFILLVVASTFMSLAAATLANWGAAYLMRSHGLTQTEVGVTVGPILGIGGMGGTIIGGFIGTWVAGRSAVPHAPLKVMLLTALPAAPFMVIFVMAPVMSLVILGGLFGGLLSAMHYGPLIAVAISRVPATSRGLAGALLVLGQTVIGFGMGPLIAGALSDALHPQLGNEALRYAMLFAPGCVVIAWTCAFAAWRRLNDTDNRGAL